MRDNTVIFVGTAMEPELRYTAKGTALCKFSLALYEGKDQDGNNRDSSFVDVTVWQEQAESVAENVTKGMRVGVLGRIRQERWETDDGQKRSKLTVTADEVLVGLRWGDVQVTRIESSQRSSSGYGGGGQTAPPPDEDPFA